MSRLLLTLDSEWSRLAGSPVARAALARWSASEPALAVFDDLDGVLEARRDPVAARSVLSGLARLAPSDELAARTLLQAVLPGIIRVAAGAGPDAIDDVVGLAWERIRTYPTTRSGSVAGNIVLDVRKQFLRQRAAARAELPGALPGPTVRSPEDLVVESDLLEQLRSARRRGLITGDEFRAIVLTRVQCEPIPDAAAAEQVNVRCLLKRRWRGERSLRATMALAG